jgi:hypothetical protein
VRCREYFGEHRQAHTISKQRNKHPQLHVDIMPVFLGSGLRSFDGSSLERVRLEKINVQEVGARTSIRFRMKQ